jgi:hypothetical protein
MTAQLHLAIDALALQLLLERAQRLVDIIVANNDLHKKPSNSLQILPARNPASSGILPAESGQWITAQEIVHHWTQPSGGGGPLAAPLTRFKTLGNSTGWIVAPAVTLRIRGLTVPRSHPNRRFSGEAWVDRDDARTQLTLVICD